VRPGLAEGDIAAHDGGQVSTGLDAFGGGDSGGGHGYTHWCVQIHHGWVFGDSMQMYIAFSLVRSTPQ
jgi:hypothetical protein